MLILCFIWKVKKRILLMDKSITQHDLTHITPSPILPFSLGPLLITWFNFNPNMDK